MAQEFGSMARWVAVAAMTLALTTTQAMGVVAQDEAGSMAPPPADLLPGVDLETEEVEPGVYRVLSDGVRGLTRPIEFNFFDTHMSPGDVHRLNALATRGLAANDNGVWLGDPDGILKLGQEDLVWEQEPSREWWEAGFDVAPDDTIYRPNRGQVLKGGKWKRPLPKFAAFRATHGANAQFTSDGAYWTKGTNGKQGTARRDVIVRRDDDGWSRIKNPPEPPGRKKDARPASIEELGVTDDGVLYITRARRFVQRLEDGRWETLPKPGGQIAQLHVGADGTVWVERREKDRWTYGGGSEVARLGENGWTGFEIGAPRYLYPSPDTVAPDGAFWAAPAGNLMNDGGCDGILRLGDTGMDRFLLEKCVYDIAAGPSGELWAEAGSWEGNWYAPESVGPVELYLITPEAWAGAE